MRDVGLPRPARGAESSVGSGLFMARPVSPTWTMLARRTERAVEPRAMPPPGRLLGPRHRDVASAGAPPVENAVHAILEPIRSRIPRARRAASA
jgi:hypothetical protein